MNHIVLVCGGRTYADRAVLFKMLDKEHAEKPIDLLVTGGAPGADALAEAWARFRNIPVRVFPAEWGKHGNAAGPIRNQQMLDEALPNHVVAFPGGRGTADMLARARKSLTVRTILVVTEKSP